ncbi:MAG: Fmu (Sun) domain protein, partial [Chitinophagales bacterium]
MTTPEFPDNFITSISAAAGFSNAAFTQAHSTPAPVSVRLHPLKNKCGFTLATNVPWCKNGYYLNERPVFTLDPLLHAGCYYVQEASSMFTGYAMQ